MDRGAWQAIVHGVARVRHDLETKPPPQYQIIRGWLNPRMGNHGYGDPTVKLDPNLQLHGDWHL